MTGNSYTLPYSLGLPSWAYYLQTVGDAAVFDATPSIPYAWQPCSTAPNCGLCSARTTSPACREPAAMLKEAGRWTTTLRALPGDIRPPPLALCKVFRAATQER